MSKTQGAEAVRGLLKRRDRPDGLFCFSDSMAIGAMDAAFEMGTSIPREMSVVGCGNLHYDSSLRVPLSSIDQRCERIGQQAAAIVAEYVTRSKYDEVPNGDKPFATVILKPELVIRESSMRKR